MPLMNRSLYPGPPRYQLNGHLQTIIPALRPGPAVHYERERIDTPDGDFLDLDWLDHGSRQLVVLSHGLEGNSQRPYVRAMAYWFAERGWDVLAWNCRSCSGEMNRTPRLYSHGQSEDLAGVIQHALRTKDYTTVILVGFSMGGALTLKYLGVAGTELPAAVRAGVAFSVPCRIEESVKALEQRANRLYKKRFFRALQAKITHKSRQFPELDLPAPFEALPRWRVFDEHYSAPLNGFTSAAEFYAYASCANYMAGIRVPTLLVNAGNDPITPPACIPLVACEQHPHVFLERPARGGHVGFELPRHDYSWMEWRTWDFLRREAASAA